MQDPTDLPGLIETVNYAALQSDRWMLVASLALIIIAGVWMTRYFTAQIQQARAESLVVTERFTTHLIKSNVELSQLVANNTKALESNTHALEKVERKLG